MPPHRNGGRPNSSRNLTEAQKGAIVALHKLSGTEFAYIAGAMGLGISTPQRVYSNVEKACADASLEPSLNNLLATVHNTPIGPPGAEAKVRNGSTLSAQIRNAIIQFGTYDIEEATLHVLQEAGITVSRPTLIKIAHEHRDQDHDYAIVRGVRPKKPELDDEDIDRRKRYVAWILTTYKRFAPRLIFVCYDETSKSIGGRNNRGGKQYVWRPRGAPANNYALPYRPPAFNLMICAATSTDTTLSSLKRPCLVWVAEEEEDREETLERVRKANERARKLVDNKRARASVAGTQEERALREINRNILHRNKAAKAANQAAGKKGAALRAGWHEWDLVFLVQDNVYLHGLGLRYCAPEIEEKDIRFAPHSPNSPDLHPIERCFGRLEGLLQDYEVKSTSKQAKNDAVAFVQAIWQEDETMRQYMANQLHPDHFKKVAKACEQAEYNENFTA
ncbi:hypothetical protein EK21DRAFT_95672 [Setomelanomma holmii]|uniref:Tc1-like transposase DDE domain-containing protein n=1 Tax=Setomelanomma holmii TaxID=210430 RepID=A0A9P4GVX0_9PLEO|nr:hypothetical protein EK21DRAFT_95680 [Setomelanomma holmii]KAF2022486.1 hypothetical protein EK21DRAFT_95672 [Setomelanomma holmii]